MKLAIFDFDGTLFLKDTLPYLLKLWGKFGYSKVRLFAVLFSAGKIYADYKLRRRKNKNREQAIPEVMRIFNSIFTGMRREEVEDFFGRCAPVIIKQLNGAVVEEIIKAKGEGYRTVLLSGCYSYLLGLIGKPLMMDDIIGTEMNYRDGLVDLSRPLHIIYGREKENSIKEIYGKKNVDWEESTAFADSFTDLSILKMVGRPVAVDPDNELKKVAESMRWRIIYFIRGI